MEAFKCPECSAPFKKLDKAKIHYQRAHKGQKLFECQGCFKGFSSKANIVRHVKNVHEDCADVDQLIVKQSCSYDDVKDEDFIAAKADDNRAADPKEAPAQDTPEGELALTPRRLNVDELRSTKSIRGQPKPNQDEAQSKKAKGELKKKAKAVQPKQDKSNVAIKAAEGQSKGELPEQKAQAVAMPKRAKTGDRSLMDVKAAIIALQRNMKREKALAAASSASGKAANMSVKEQATSEGVGKGAKKSRAAEKPAQHVAKTVEKAAPEETPKTATDEPAKPAKAVKQAIRKKAAPEAVKAPQEKSLAERVSKGEAAEEPAQISKTAEIEAEAPVNEAALEAAVVPEDKGANEPAEAAKGENKGEQEVKKPAPVKASNKGKAKRVAPKAPKKGKSNKAAASKPVTPVELSKVVPNPKELAGSTGQSSITQSAKPAEEATEPAETTKPAEVTTKLNEEITEPAKPTEEAAEPVKEATESAAVTEGATETAAEAEASKDASKQVEVTAEAHEEPANLDQPVQADRLLKASNSSKRKQASSTCVEAVIEPISKRTRGSRRVAEPAPTPEDPPLRRRSANGQGEQSLISTKGRSKKKSTKAAKALKGCQNKKRCKRVMTPGSTSLEPNPKRVLRKRLSEEPVREAAACEAGKKEEKEATGEADPHRSFVCYSRPLCKSEEALRAYRLRHVPNKCVSCSKAFFTKDDLHLHRQQVHSVYQCHNKACESLKPFNTSKERYFHAKEVHQQVPQTEMQYILFGAPTSLEKHL